MKTTNKIKILNKIINKFEFNFTGRDKVIIYRKILILKNALFFYRKY